MDPPGSLRPEDIFKPQSADLLDDTRTWVDPSGYRLSDRVWRTGDDTRRQIDQALREGIATGRSPIEVGRGLEQFLSPSWAPKRTASGRLEAGQPKNIVTRTPSAGGGSYPARRLARTEITRAFGRSTLEAAAASPFDQGCEWALSPGHRDTDVCDRHSKGHSRGMEPGQYRVEEFPRYPAHPQDKCYVTRVPATDAQIQAAIQKMRQDREMGFRAPDNAAHDPMDGSSWRDRTIPSITDTQVALQRQYLERQAADWVASLTRKDKSGIESYSSDFYKNMNGHLRHGQELSAYDAQSITKMSGAIDKFEVGQDLHVFRGVSSTNPMHSQQLDTIGTEFVDKGFTSTTIDPDLAQRWLNNKPGGEIIEIIVPKGTRGAYIEPASGRTGEFEFTLQHGTRFRAVGRSSRGNVMMEVVS